MAQNAKSIVMDKLESDKGYQERLDVRRKENETLHKSTLAYNTDMHDHQK